MRDPKANLPARFTTLQYERAYYEHELCRLRASERAGFKAAK